jgi:hypothetical protein
MPGILAADFGIELTTHDAETLCNLAPVHARATSETVEVNES